MKKFRLSFILLILVVIPITGCVFVEQDEIYNNSNQDLTIVARHSATDSTTRILKKGETIEFYSPFIEVRHGNLTWRYERKPFALEFRKSAGEKHLMKFYKRAGGNRILVKLQIQPDGAIYLRPPDSYGPITDFPSQPEGFPLKPRNE